MGDDSRAAGATNMVDSTIEDLASEVEKRSCVVVLGVEGEEGSLRSELRACQGPEGVEMAKTKASVVEDGDSSWEQN